MTAETHKYVFVDTSIFEENNFLESARINQLLKQSEAGELTIVLPRITYNEVIARARTHIKYSVNEANKARKVTRILRNITSQRQKFDTLKEKECIEEFVSTFQQRLQQANCLMLDYPTIDTKEIFDKYFTNEWPFNKADKKHEFPDAIALITIEQWCAESGHDCHVLSVDKDMLNYDSPFLLIEKDYKSFLADFVLGIEEHKSFVDQLLNYLHSHLDEVEFKVRTWVLGSLDDERQYTDVIDYMDVIDIDSDILTFKLSSAQLVGTHNESATFELVARVNFQVKVEIPDAGSGWYDDEEREWHYSDTTICTIEQEQVFPVEVTVAAALSDSEAESYTLFVQEINGGQELAVRDERDFRYK
jgi:hypothetical protein